MRRSLPFLNLALLVAAGLLGYRLRAEWKNHRARVQGVYQASAGEQETSPAIAAAAPGLESWADIVARNVFVAERSNVSAAASVPPPEPILFGTMNLGSGPIALMSEGPGRGFRQVHLGEAVGGYTLVAVEGQTVTLEWTGGRIKVDAAESASRLRSGTSSSAPVAPVAGPGRPTAAGSSLAVVSPAAPASTSGSKILERYPEWRGLASREQLAELEREPPGTIKNGKRKVVAPWPFGLQILWEDVKPGEEKK